MPLWTDWSKLPVSGRGLRPVITVSLACPLFFVCHCGAYACNCICRSVILLHCYYKWPQSKDSSILWLPVLCWKFYYTIIIHKFPTNIRYLDPIETFAINFLILNTIKTSDYSPKAAKYSLKTADNFSKKAIVCDPKIIFCMTDPVL